MFTIFVSRYLDDLVSPRVGVDPVERGTHRAFMGLRITFAFVAMLIFPSYLMHAQTTTLLETSVFFWFVTPLLAVSYLSRTGNYDTALLLSTVLSLPFLAIAAVMTGGAVASSFMIWLLTPLMEAILSKHRRAVIHSGLLILVTASVILACDFLNPVKTLVLSPEDAALISIATVIAAIFYVTLIALVLESVSNLGAIVTEENADKYRLLASNMTDAILRHDMHGNVRFASSAIEALTGIPAHHATRMGVISAQIDPEDREIYKDALILCLKTKQPVSVVFKLVGAPEFANMSLEKRMSWLEDALNSASNLKPVVWIEMKAQPIADNSLEIVSVWRDVTARRMHESKIESVQRETARVQEMKSRFLANITHELRTPLNAVLGFSQMLMMGEQMKLDEAKRAEYAGLIHEAGDHLLSIVNSFLDMSKLNSGRFEMMKDDFVLGDLVEQCKQIISIRAEQAGVKLHSVIAANVPEIHADKRAIRQIMLNLLSNSIKFTPKGGSITIHTRFQHNAFVLTVADTGVGIAPDDIEHVGEAFYQARGEYDRPYEGTGLGLSIVKGLVALHDGTFTIKSKQGVGTVVTVELPYDNIPFTLRKSA